MATPQAHRWRWISLQAPFLCAFVGYRIGAAASYQPVVWPDSEGYMGVSKHGWLSLQLWAGSRAPLVPVLMKLTRSYYGYGVLEGILGALAWAFLAYTMSRLVPGGWRQMVVMLLVLGFAASPLVVMWDGSALSESPSLSVLALLLASGIWLVRRFTWIRLAVLGVLALAFCTLRDEGIWTVGTVGFVLLGFGLVAAIQGLMSDRRGAATRLRENWTRARGATAVGLVLLVIAGVTEAGAASSHRNVQNVQHVFFVRVFPDRSRVAWFASHGMPMAAQIDLLADETGAAPGTAPIVAPDLDTKAWAPLEQWLAGPALSTYALYLVLHPGYLLTAPLQRPQLAYNNANGDVAFYQATGYALSPALGELFTPDRFVVLFLFVLALLVGVHRRVWRLGVWRFTALFALLGVWAMLLAWHGDGMETARHVVEGEVAVRLGVLVALLLALFAAPAPSPEAGSRQVEDHLEERTETPVFQADAGASLEPRALVGARGRGALTSEKVGAGRAGSG